VRAGAGGVVGPRGPPPGDPPIVSRARARLRHHGARTHGGMVVRRPRALGNHGIQLFDVVCVYRGRHRARRARGAVRAPRHGLRPRVHPRTGGGRVTGWNRAARAVLAAGALSVVGAAYGWFVLPESLGAERRASFAWRRAN